MTCQPTTNYSQGDRVRIKDNGEVATILMADPDPDTHAKVEGNQTWYLKFDNGSEGGGWKDLDLLPYSH